MANLKTLWNNKYFWMLLTLSAMSVGKVRINAQEQTDTSSEFIKTVATPGPRVNIDSLRNLSFKETWEYGKNARRQPTHVQVDTILVDGENPDFFKKDYRGIYYAGYNVIVLNWFVIDSAFRARIDTKQVSPMKSIFIENPENSNKGIEEAFIHEKKHADDELNYNELIATTPEHMVQYDIHCEIAARVATLLNFNRNKWIKTKDKHKAFPSDYNYQPYASYLMEHPNIGNIPSQEEAQVILRTSLQKVIGIDDDANISHTGYGQQALDIAELRTIESSYEYQRIRESESDTLVIDTNFNELIHNLYTFQASDGKKFNILDLGGTAAETYIKLAIYKSMGLPEIKDGIKNIKKNLRFHIRHNKHARKYLIARKKIILKEQNESKQLDTSNKKYFSRD